MSSENDLNLPPLNPADLSFDNDQGSVARSGPVPVKTAEDLEQVFDVPVTVSAVLGSSKIAVGDLLQIVPVVSAVLKALTLAPVATYTRLSSHVGVGPPAPPDVPTSVPFATYTAATMPASVVM